MRGGYAGKILNIDLSKGRIDIEELSDKLCRDFIGGYGIGARILFSRQKPRVDPLGPENILGFVTGPLTGTYPFGSRFTVVAKSPLTHTWGDANSGGDFGPKLRFAGYDAVFLSGISEKPVYLFIDDGRVELKEAAHLWGKDTYETQDLIKAEFGKDASVACIGQSGEKLSLISCIINDKGRAAARSGLGAVMGAKRLKAVVVRGNREIPVVDRQGVEQKRNQILTDMRDDPVVERFRKFGTSANMAANARIGDAPVKNWGGVALLDYPDAVAMAATFDPEKTAKYVAKRYACWHCPVGCGALLKSGDGEYQYEVGTHRPEYETMAAFGSNCLNSNIEAIITANDICSRYGLDTISTGATIAFAIECYENGLITKEDTDGIELHWGNHKAIVAMTQKVAERRGFGDILADGTKAAAEKIGGNAQDYAMHIQGQELGMHDPRLRPGWITAYKMDATPGRHSQGGAQLLEGRGGSKGINVKPIQPYIYTGKGDAQRKMSAYIHVLNASGLCMFTWISLGAPAIVRCLQPVTGWDLTINDLMKIGDRIATIRHAFNIREGFNSVEFNVPGRIIGQPPLKGGPTQGVTIDIDTQVREYLDEMGWDIATGQPNKRALEELDLGDVAETLRTM